MTAKKSPLVRAPKKKRAPYYTIGVRFLRSEKLYAYTYRVKPTVKLTLGQEVIVPTQIENHVINSVGVVVEIHTVPKDTSAAIEYHYITGTIREV